MSDDNIDSSAHPLIIQAEQKLAAQLGLQPSQITITKGEAEDGWVHVVRDDDKTTLNFVVKAPGSMFDETIAEGIRTKLSQWEPVKKWLWDDRTKLAKDLEFTIRKATADLPDFNQDLLKWPQLKPEIAKKSYQAKSYALEDLQFLDYGVITRLTIPKDENTDNTPQLQKLADSINDPTRNNEIKEILTARIADRYIEAKMKKDGKIDAEAIKTARDKARQDIGQMVIHAEVDTGWRGAGVKVSFRSPRQALERAKVPNDEAEAPNKSELQAENPIYLLDHEITKTNPHPPGQKAVARSLLFDKNKKPIPQFVEIAGSVDMQAAFAKEFYRISQAHPEKATEKAAVFKEILESPILKDRYMHDPKQPDASPEEARFKEMGNKTDMIRIELPIESKNIKATLEAMAGIAQTVVPPVTTTVTPIAGPQTATATPSVATIPAEATLTTPTAVDINAIAATATQNVLTSMGIAPKPASWTQAEGDKQQAKAAGIPKLG